MNQPTTVSKAVALSPVPPYIEALSPYVPGKPIEETEREYGIKGAIKLASNENPLGPSPKALAALHQGVGKLHLYPDGSGFYLKRKLADVHQVSPAEIFLGSGSNEIIELLVRTFMGEGDNAVVSDGSFVIYRLALQAHGRQVLSAPMRDRHYDLEAMAERIGPRTRLVFLANPDNPTGTYFGSEALERFLARVPPQVIVCLDEAYFEYATAADYPDGTRYQREFPNVVVTRTFSKIYGLAGLRLGYAVLNARFGDYLNRTRMPFNVSSLAGEAGLAALDDQEFVRWSQKVNQAGLAFLNAELPKLGVEALPTQANFLFVDFKQPALPVYEKLLRQGVITRPLTNYGFPTALRISVGKAEDNQRLLGALRGIL